MCSIHLPSVLIFLDLGSGESYSEERFGGFFFLDTLIQEICIENETPIQASNLYINKELPTLPIISLFNVDITARNYVCSTIACFNT
jgi:hypothetical protein